MNNYIIIENRPELTQSQVVAGMNFAAVAAGAIALSAGAVGGKAIGAGLFTKGFIAVLAVVAGIAVFKSRDAYKSEHVSYAEPSQDEHILYRSKSKGPVLVMETLQ